MANVVYNRGKAFLFNDAAAITSRNLYVMLVQASYDSAVNATHNVVSDVNSYELTSYSRVTLSNVTVTEDDTNGFAYLDADDVTFSAVSTGQTVGGAILYVGAAYATTNDSTSEVLAFYDMANQSTNGSDVVLQWATPANGGVLKVS